MPTTPDPNPWFYRGERTNTYTDKSAANTIKEI
jgi:hypothetical protein